MLHEKIYPDCEAKTQIYNYLPIDSVSITTHF